MKIKPRNLILPIYFIVLIFTTIISNNTYIIHMLFMLTIYSILSCSLNIAVGITGLSNMSHATFFGVGAYVAALASLRWGVPFYITLLMSGLLTTLCGLLLGMPTLRLRGTYLAIVTIGFGQIVRIIELNWISVTRGPMGLPGIPGAVIGSYSFSPKAYIFYGILIVMLTLFVIQRLIKSKIGRALAAIKSDEIVAKTLGVNITKYKVLAFVLSAFFAGMAGSIYAHYISFVSPDTFKSSDSIIILCMVILGGSNTLYGTLFSTLILVLIPEILRFADIYRLIFVGVIMVVAVLVKEGNLGKPIKIWLKKKMPVIPQKGA